MASLGINMEIDKAIETYKIAMKAHLEAKNSTVREQLKETATRKALALARNNLRAVELEQQIY